MTGKEYIEYRINTGDRFLVNLHKDSRELLAIILEQYAALRQPPVSGSCQHEFVWLIPDEDDSLDRKCEKCGFVEWHDH